MPNYNIRNSTLTDVDQIYNLYKHVVKTVGGLARTEGEITRNYIENFTTKAKQNGIQLVVEDTENNNQLIAEIHCYKLEPLVFSHVLSELTIAVHPNYQNKGLGKLLFKKLFHTIETERNDILRVELIARESNTRAIAFYKTLHFVVEGRFEKRIHLGNNTYEADIPMAWTKN